MYWQKLGKLSLPHTANSWMHSHAFLPTPYLLRDDIIRIFFSYLDKQMIGRIAYVDVSAKDPKKIITVSKHPILDIGEAGCFDDSGVNPACVIPVNDQLYMYYVGWQRGVKTPYTLFTGLATSDNQGESFHRVSQVPILERANNERFVRTAAHVHFDKNKWRMWYIGGDEWKSHHNKQFPSYGLRYTESEDGIHWEQHSRVCMNPNGDDEFGFGRPWIKKVNSRYHMLYSIRRFSNGYRLGYATSEDGITWQRKDDSVGIDVSDTGWDSDMQCFGYPVTTNTHTYLFYNGNNYGETGMGIARLKGLSDVF